MDADVRVQSELVVTRRLTNDHVDGSCFDRKGD